MGLRLFPHAAKSTTMFNAMTGMIAAVLAEFA